MGGQQMSGQQMRGGTPKRGAQQTQPPGQQVQPVGQGTQPGGQMARGMQQAPTPPQLQPVTVEDIIQTDVVTAERDTPIRTIVAQMAERDVGTVLVVEEDQPIGVITDRQVALALEETPDLTERTAEELLSDELLTGRIDMNLFEVIQQLNEANVRRLPIVDDDNTLVGIVSLDDVLVVLGVELRNAVDIIKAQSPRM